MGFDNQTRQFRNSTQLRPSKGTGRPNMAELPADTPVYRVVGSELYQYIKVDNTVYEQKFTRSVKNPERPRFELGYRLEDGFKASVPGYQIFDSGLIIQWGTKGDGTTDDLGQSEAIVFPKKFPRAVFSITASHGAEGTDTHGTAGVGIRIATLTTLGVTLSTAPTEEKLFWIAIGH